jgi:hypothetical protein
MVHYTATIYSKYRYISREEMGEKPNSRELDNGDIMGL